MRLSNQARVAVAVPLALAFINALVAWGNATQHRASRTQWGAAGIFTVFTLVVYLLARRNHE